MARDIGAIQTGGRDIGAVQSAVAAAAFDPATISKPDIRGRAPAERFVSKAWLPVAAVASVPTVSSYQFPMRGVY